MKRLPKLLLIALVALVALGAVLLLGLNLYVQSPATQGRIQAELSKALKLPLVITNTSLTPWSGMNINGITVPADGGNFLEAASFGAHYKLLPLLRRRLVIFDVKLEQPKIVWRQNADGKWVLPGLAKKAAPGEQKPVKKEEKKSGGGFEVELTELRIVGGSVDMLDVNGKCAARLVGADLNYVIESATKGRGTLVASRLTAGTLGFETVTGEFKYDAGVVTIPALEGTLAGGSVKGTLELRPDEAKGPFTMSLAWDKVDAATLSTDAGWEKGQVSGTLGGELELHGRLKSLDKLEGSGKFSMANGQLKQLDFFQTIGQLLQIEGLSNLRLQRGVTTFRIADERAYVEEFVLETQDIRLSAEGQVKMDGKMALDARLALSPGLAKDLPTFVRQSFVDVDAEGRSGVAFRITGKTDRPKTDLAEKLVGRKLGDQFGNVLSKLFDTKADDKPKEEPKKKKKKDKSKPATDEPAAPVTKVEPVAPAQ